MGNNLSNESFAVTPIQDQTNANTMTLWAQEVN